MFFIGVSTADPQEDQAAVKQSLVTAYKTHLAESVRAELAMDNQLHLGADGKQLKRWSNTWWAQFTVLFWRGIKERKHESFSTLKIVQVLVVSVLCGLLWWQSDISHLQDQVRSFSSWFTKPMNQSIRCKFGREKSYCRWGFSSSCRAFGASTLSSKPSSHSLKND